ncbi:MAG: nuclear transport factor 2 family protein [Anaerolineales bacterium]
MAANPSPHPIEIVKRFQAALNSHDLDAFVACFSADYDSQQPAFPDRAFRGSEQVQKNWGQVFADIPDFHAELLRVAESGDTVWSEWHWHGTPAAGGAFNWRGVIILGVKAGRIAWGRLYIGPVQEAGGGIDAAVQSMAHGSAQADQR